MPNFNPETDQPYGECTDCHQVFATEPLADEHMTTKHHTIYITNPSRADRIDMFISERFDDLVDDFLAKLNGYVLKGDLTGEEVASALNGLADPSAQWRDYYRPA